MQTPKATALTPTEAPIGTFENYGENFGFYSEAGSTPFNYIDFSLSETPSRSAGCRRSSIDGDMTASMSGCPFSAKSGPVVVKRAANMPKPDGTCCADKQVLETQVGTLLS